MIPRRSFLKTILPLPMVTSLAKAQSAGEGDKAQLSIGIIADPQYANKEARGSRYYRESLGKLRRAIAELNQHQLDLVVTLGDLIDEDFSSFNPVLKEYQALKVPYYHVLGNHDFSVSDAEKARVPETLGLGKATYFSQQHGSWRLIYLDGTELSVFRYGIGDLRREEAQAYLDKLTEAKAARGRPWNSGLTAKQFNWLEQELQAAKQASQRVLLFNHLPVLPAEDGHNLWNAPELVTLLEKHDHVAAYLNGHNHAGNYAQHQGAHYVNFKGMVETQAETAYAIVRCFQDRLEINGYGAEPSRSMR
ncbi:metallophosphoesterase [Rubritalea halochordaticola]